MPKVWQKYIKSDSLSGLWQISESEEELRALLFGFPEEKFAHAQRARQWLASRVLLRDLLKELGYGSDFVLDKLPDGQPKLSIEGLHISISHAGDYAAVAISGSRIGIDIEKVSTRIQRVAHKFMNESDLRNLKNKEDIVWMHTVWSAKEALFKYFPENAIDFREHLHIDSIKPDRLFCRVSKGGANVPAMVPYIYFDDYVMAWAWELPPLE